MITTLALIAVLAAALMYLINRDLTRAVARQRQRAWLRAHPEYQRIQATFVQLQIELRDNFTPAMLTLLALSCRHTKWVAKRMTELTDKLERSGER